MEIVVFTLTFFYFLFYGRSLIRSVSEKPTDAAQSKRQGIALILFIALIVFAVNVAGWGMWFGFLAAAAIGYQFNSDIE